MKTPSLIVLLSLAGSLAGCQTLDCKQVVAKLDAQSETLHRIERGSAERLHQLQDQLQTQLQAHEHAIKAIERKDTSLSREQAALQCMLRSERVQLLCISHHSTETDPAIFDAKVRSCMSKDPNYRPNLASCQPKDETSP